MALSKPTLKSAIKAAFDAQATKTSDPAAALDNLADQIANAVDAYIKSIQITYTSGLVAPSGGGPVTGTLVYTIS